MISKEKVERAKVHRQYKEEEKKNCGVKLKNSSKFIMLKLLQIYMYRATPWVCYRISTTVSAPLVLPMKTQGAKRKAEAGTYSTSAVRMSELVCSCVGGLAWDVSVSSR